MPRSVKNKETEPSATQSSDQELAACRAELEKYRQLFQIAPLPYQSLDSVGKFLEVNQAWLDTLGYRRQDVIGGWFGNFLTARSLPTFQENFPVFMQTGKVRGVNLEMVRSDGTPIWVSLDGTIARDHKDNFLGTHCIFNDITDQRRSQEALAESEAKYRSVVDNSQDGIVIVQQGRLVFWNRRVEKVSGMGPDELRGAAVEDFIHPDDRADLMQSYSVRLKGEQAGPPRTYRLLSKSGRETLVQIHSSPIPWGEGQALLSCLTDISEVVEARCQLERSKERYRLLAEASPVCILAFDEKGVIDFVNQRHLQVFGGGRQEAAHYLGQKAWQLEIFKRGGISDQIRSVLDGRQVEVEHRLFPGIIAGHDGYVSVRAVPIQQKEKVLGGIIICEDVTDQITAGHEREKLIDELRRSLEQVRTLRGLIPICANCKKIRNDQGYWQQVEEYVREHSQARFSHGICPSCAQRLYPGLLEDSPPNPD